MKYVIISIDTKEAFDKMQHHLLQEIMIKRKEKILAFERSPEIWTGVCQLKKAEQGENFFPCFCYSAFLFIWFILNFQEAMFLLTCKVLSLIICKSTQQIRNKIEILKTCKEYLKNLQLTPINDESWDASSQGS
jgi:hypothetical protein